VRGALPRRFEPSRLYLLGPISGHGLRAVDLSREPARHRSLPRRHARQALSHGFRGKVARSTLADANDAHDWRVYADFAQVLIATARPLYAAEPMGVELKQSLYALDSTTIDLC